MAFVKLTEDVENIQKLDDRPQLSASDLKACFDKAGVDIKSVFNNLIDQLEAYSCATNLGATALGDEYESENVQGILEELKDASDLLKVTDNITAGEAYGYPEENLTSRLNRIKNAIDDLIIGELPEDFMSLVAKQVTLDKDDWILNQQTNYYENTITDSTVTQNHYIIINMDLDNQMKIKDIGVESINGGVKIYTTKLPQEDIAATMVIQGVTDVTDSITIEEIQDYVDTYI